MTIETKDINSNEIYKLMIGSILPRPIAWIGSCSKQGLENLAAFSFFTVASVEPPVVSFSILNKGQKEEKATLKNIRDTEYFSISIVNEDLAKAMAISTKAYDEFVDKYEVSKVTKEKCQTIPAFYVKESLVSYECKLREVINFGEDSKSGNLVLADVIAINVDDKILDFPKIDIGKLNPIGRLSGSYYCTSKEKFEIEKDN